MFFDDSILGSLLAFAAWVSKYLTLNDYISALGCTGTWGLLSIEELRSTRSTIGRNFYDLIFLSDLGYYSGIKAMLPFGRFSLSMTTFFLGLGVYWASGNWLFSNFRAFGTLIVSSSSIEFSRSSFACPPNPKSLEVKNCSAVHLSF